MNPRFKFKDFHCKVYVEDTDFQGVVYHANYLKYFERARSQFLIDNNLSQIDAMSQGNESYVVKSINLSYHQPALLEDDLTVKLKLSLLPKLELNFFNLF